MSTLEWALSILAREAESEIFGSVSFLFKNGKIVNAKVERSEIPSIDKNHNQP